MTALVVQGEGEEPRDRIQFGRPERGQPLAGVGRPGLLLCDGLTGAADDDAQFFHGMATELREAGEIRRDVDPRSLMPALFGAALAPAAVPHTARGMTGLDRNSPEFVTGYRILLKGSPGCYEHGHASALA
ncbi:hypothetical protein [Allorhizocola rhizosphaerae]|uniref:hypothetical protein n=1 Tax=Allorhizocola rhizosphaerae TaxID=1872709 RepID=UPI000E3C13BA|nr:hypothetical protein [Allorhizocola rhizosphaerae]